MSLSYILYQIVAQFGPIRWIKKAAGVQCGQI
ncbi:hypothetical protein T01_9974 [Trichinella spiralis]|uniref:Uncharacterized protein n=1 Tax=Trichinella spiralis TaxID=6334 RepID=A0A0V0YW56_TRISP|nr:hypothetical protein T01_9974 [Trichinella spiralis]